jgi:hypothetical protein
MKTMEIKARIKIGGVHFFRHILFTISTMISEISKSIWLHKNMSRIQTYNGITEQQIPRHMTLEIQNLILDSHNNVAGLNQLNV